MKIFYTGDAFTFYKTDLAEETWKKLKEEASFESSLIQLGTRIKRYGDLGKLHAPGQINQEEDGFFAIKSKSGKVCIRAYCWYGTQRKSILISHFIQKTKDKLDKNDQTIMSNQRNKYRGK